MKELIHFSYQRQISQELQSGHNLQNNSLTFACLIPNLPFLHSSSKGDTQKLYLHPNSTSYPSGKGKPIALGYLTACAVLQPFLPQRAPEESNV